MRKLKMWTIYACLFIIFTAWITVGFWLWYPYRVFHFYTDKALILTKEVKAGEILMVQGDTLHLTKGKRVDVTPQLIDGSLITYPSFSYISDGKRFRTVRLMEIPGYLSPGKYHINFNISVQVNPLRTIHVIRQTEDFYIVK